MSHTIHRTQIRDYLAMTAILIVSLIGPILTIITIYQNWGVTNFNTVLEIATAIGLWLFCAVFVAMLYRY